MQLMINKQAERGQLKIYGVQNKGYKQQQFRLLWFIKKENGSNIAMNLWKMLLQ